MDTLKGEKHGSIGLQEALWVVPFPGKFASRTQQVLAINEVTPSSDLASHRAGMQCMDRGHCYCHLAKSIQLSFTKQTTSLTSDRKGSKPAEKRAQLFYWVRTSLQYNNSHKRVESNIDIIYILSRFLNENKGKIILPMSKLNGTLTQIRWETAAAGNTCAACCRLQNRHLGSIWLIMIYFSCNHLFMPLWFIFRGTGLRAKGLGAGVGKHHQSHGILGRTHGHSCPSPTWEWTPVLLPPPHQPIPEDVGCSSHTGKNPAFFPQPVLCWRHGPGPRARTSMHMLFSIHFDQKKTHPWGLIPTPISKNHPWEPAKVLLKYSSNLLLHLRSEETKPRQNSG